MQGPNRSDSFAGPLNEARAASTAGGGTALTSTAVIVPFLNGTTHVGMVVRNFSTAVVVKFGLCPWLVMLRTDNALGTTTDYSVQGQKSGGTGVTLDALATLANGGALYLGSHVPFRGVAVTMSASVNAVASTIGAHYWTGSAWVSLAPTDGTTSGGATFAQTGNVTWTVPSAWTKDFLQNTKVPAPDINFQQQAPYATKKKYWARLSTSAALSATVSAALVMALNRSTAYAEAVEGSVTQFRVTKQEEGTSGLELLTNAGTANAIVNCYGGNNSEVFS